MVLPAPKGAFITRNGVECPCFVEYAAISLEHSQYPNIYGIGLNFNDTYVEIQEKQDGEKLRTEVWSGVLIILQEAAIENGEDDLRWFVIATYQSFKSHGTPMDLSAIEWFREKFKEHNITKADFDVFA